jgi:cell division protease FtsH
VKFLLLLVLVWFILVWSAMANDPLVGFADALRIEIRSGAWVFVLMGLEVIRQVHFLVSEHWAGYHRFWTRTVFGGFERATHRHVSDWSRFRIRRLLTWVFWIAVAAVVTGKVIHTSPFLALLRAPQLLWHLLPFVLQLALPSSSSPSSSSGCSGCSRAAAARLPTPGSGCTPAWAPA